MRFPSLPAGCPALRSVAARWPVLAGVDPGPEYSTVVESFLRAFLAREAARRSDLCRE
jgi:hypothetical protein